MLCFQQKFRLHTRRSPVIHNNANSQTTPLFLVGNIYVQPSEYGAVATTTTGSGELTKVTAPSGIYAPVAAHPPATAVMKSPQLKQLEVSQRSNSEERTNHSEGAVHSNSAASSSSTHTTTTSPRC